LKKRLYPAVLERGPRGALGAWFPDFPGCVAGGRSQEEAIERAEGALARAVDGMA
jgi:predicted RNase H-like HicB family nuclease